MKLEYDNISPVTGNKCVLAEANTSDGSESYDTTGAMAAYMNAISKNVKRAKN